MRENFPSLLCLLTFSHFLATNYASPLAPAIYVFGDSLADSGNNNFLPTLAKANYPPYGTSFFGGPTGRFTDGRTVADFLAEFLGLPYPPPYMSVRKLRKLTGLNYASGSCGILPETGSDFGTCLNFDKQIDLFQNTVHHLKGQFMSSEKFSHYLSKSWFIVTFGSNDFIINYARPGSNLSKQYTPPAFGHFLSQQLSKRLQRLYRLGARKFLVTNGGAIGCMPTMLNELKPSTPCVEPLNAMVSLYNVHLPALLKQLQSTLPGSKFLLGDIFDFFLDVIAAPATYGLKDARNSCCMDIAGNGTSPCLPNKKPCNDIGKHIFFDAFHTTQAYNVVLARRFFIHLSVCTPISLNQILHLA